MEPPWEWTDVEITRWGEGRNDSKDDLNTWYCVDIHADPPSSAASGMDFENSLVLHYGRDGL